MKRFVVCRSSPWLWLWPLLLVLALFASAPAFAIAQPESVERQVKAAYLYRFGSYVEWPDKAFADQGSPFVVGVIGADDLAEELSRIVAQHTIAGRRVTVRKMQRDDLADPVNMLFIGRAENNRLKDILAAVKGRPTLTITETDNALSMGSMINFQVVDDRVRFEVALDPAEGEGLKISSRMLSVALQVTKRRQ